MKLTWHLCAQLGGTFLNEPHTDSSQDISVIDEKASWLTLMTKILRLPQADYAGGHRPCKWRQIARQQQEMRCLRDGKVTCNGVHGIHANSLRRRKQGKEALLTQHVPAEARQSIMFKAMATRQRRSAHLAAAKRLKNVG